MVELSRLVDTKRPLASVTLLGSLLATVVMVIALFSHNWISSEISTLLLTVDLEIGLFTVQEYRLSGGGGRRDKASYSETSIAEWRSSACAAVKPYNAVASSGTSSGGNSTEFMQNSKNRNAFSSSSSNDVRNTKLTEVETETQGEAEGEPGEPGAAGEEGTEVEAGRQSATACAFVSHLYYAGYLSVCLIVLCCIFFSLSYLDMRQAVCIAESIERQIPPHQALLLRNTRDFQTSQQQQQQQQQQPAAAFTEKHPAKQQQQQQKQQETNSPESSGFAAPYLSLQKPGGPVDSNYHSIAEETAALESGQCQTLVQQQSPRTSEGETPTIVAYRSLRTLDSRLSESLCQDAHRSINRCKRRFTVNLIILLMLGFVWGSLLGEAQYAKSSLAQSISGNALLGESPIIIRPSYDLYFIAGITIFTFFVKLFQSQYHSTDFVCFSWQLNSQTS